MRRHAVLVPGFVGFDALGQLPYYAGVSRIFAKCRAEAGPPGLSVHYFDNYPTASVAVRAKQLHRYLAKRVARGEFAPGDRVVLVGHSTGGLDIRKLLLDLSADLDAVVTVDVDCRVRNADIHGFVDRAVFLSVPHYGTRLADLSGPFGPWMQGFASDAADAIVQNTGWRARVRQWLTAHQADSEVGLVRALHQALEESDELGDTTAYAQATARTARLEWAAWLEHVAEDLSALADLGTRPPPDRDGAELSPAHFDARARAAEIAAWPTDLTTRSYVTRVDPASVEPPQAITLLARALAATLDVPWVGSSIAAAGNVSRALPLPNPVPTGVLAAGVLEWLPRAPFELFYTACTSPSRPFERPPGLPPRLETLDGEPPWPVARVTEADNDGVVNSLSMLWPWEPERPERHSFVLVEADHGDIIGHGPAPSEEASLRRRSYDLFQAPRPITASELEAVWRDIYAFATA